MLKSIVAALTLTTCVSACMTLGSSCPAPTKIDGATQRQAAEEMADLAPDSAISKVLAASLNDRDKLRACRKIH